MLCFSSSYLKTLLGSVPAHMDTAIIIPEAITANIEHVVKILEHGDSDISVGERRTYFGIVEEAQQIGIYLENVSIFKKRLDRIEKEELDNSEKANIPPLMMNSDSTTNLNIKQRNCETKNDELEDLISDVLLHEEVNNYNIHQMEDEADSTRCEENIQEEQITKNSDPILSPKIKTKLALDSQHKGNFDVSNQSLVINSDTTSKHTNANEGETDIDDLTNLTFQLENLIEEEPLHNKMDESELQPREDDAESSSPREDIGEEQIADLITSPTFKAKVAQDAHQKSGDVQLKQEEMEYDSVNSQHMFQEIDQKPARIENEHQCKICEKTYNSKYGLLKHIASKHEGIRYSCLQCSYKASHKGTLKEHVQFVHEGKGQDCPICDTKHATKHHLKLHIEAKHEGIRHPCSQCSYQGSSKYVLAQHKLNMHTDFKELHSCDKCENEYASKNRLRLHIAKKHEGKRYPCEECQFKASEPAYLRKHIKVIHRNIRVSCPLCDAKLSSNHEVKLHVESKHEGIKHPCSQCSFQGSSKNTLTQHTLKMHTDYKSTTAHKCTQCGNEYASKNRLNQHIATKHDGIRYPCEECHFSASEPSSLKMHVKTIHQNIRIPCQQCDSTHASRQNLKIHIESKHEGIKHPCSLCPFQGASKHSIKQHVLRIHSKNTE